EWPPLASFYRRLAGMGRLILFDKRGTGLSDRVLGIASLEERMDDVRAVMDAVGAERAALIGVSEGGPLCTLFAATHPRRTLALGALGGLARGHRGPGCPERAQPGGGGRAGADRRAVGPLLDAALPRGARARDRRRRGGARVVHVLPRARRLAVRRSG